MDENQAKTHAKLVAKIHNEQLKLAGTVVTRFGVIMIAGSVSLIYATFNQMTPQPPADWMWALGFAGLMIIFFGVMLLLKMRSED